MNNFELLIFDLDGTLVDSSADIIAAVNFTRKSLALPIMDQREIIRLVGDGTDKLVERLIGAEHQDRYAEALAIFLAYYGEHLLDHATLYADVTDVLDYFRHKKKVIITNKRENMTRKMTDAFSLTGRFDAIVGVGTTPFRKPDARIVLPVLARFRVEPHRAIIFGDGIADIQVAKNAGIKSCALLNGFTPREVLLALKPDFTCEHLRDIKTLFSCEGPG
jgi:phosphoglycolate phosphatase